MTFTNLSRLSLNQMTTQRWSLREAIDGCVRAGIPAIGIWRDKIAEAGLDTAVRLVRDAGLHVSSVCRGGMFPAATADERRARIDDNRRAIDEAAALAADTLVLVCGAAPNRDIRAARVMVAEAIAELAPYAREHGVRLGIEPLHPMFAADRSVITTLGEALDLAEQFDPATVGVIIDAYHVWWDPYLDTQINRSRGRVAGFHVSDWLVPTPHMLLGRGMMGDGVIALRDIRMAVDAVGYSGPIEVEIFNQSIWNQPGEQVVAQMCQRYMEHV
ncbi:MAG TPA: sugar phosphate isomerase/epimerase family protein [Roseiflexaceae bacterium]|nr:sugar phosphate isomerase/epimerase family protein [Roseiflexaceae bacterium]HMP40236.1 sugar phosphate isomerase/epimerase family protein [Roseiflexaceae bacterium]